MTTITEVLFVPALDRRLLSIPALTAKGWSVAFGNTLCSVSFEGEEVPGFPKRSKMFVLEEGDAESDSVEIGFESYSASRVEIVNGEMGEERELYASVWHARLGHTPAANLRNMSSAMTGLPSKILVPSTSELCEGCADGKPVVQSFPKSQAVGVKATRLLEIVHSDVVGSMETKSQGGANYVVTLIDDFSRYTPIYFVKAKSDT